ncbi:MAG TPA: hypothetical protein VJ821_00490 [Anaerolineales bacterium]|nr:hypothetical protein [Anaerolineales bacterium]
MSFIIPIIIVFLLCLGGIYLGGVAYREYRHITISNDTVSMKKLIGISALFGVSSTLLFLGIILMMGVVDENYIWSIQKFLGAILVSIIPGAVVTLGSMYQIYSTIKYRDTLMSSLRKRNSS